MDKDKIIEAVEKMSVLELSGLVKALEEKFGVSAALPTAMASAAGTGPAEEESAAKEEKTTFAVHLTSGGGQKIQVIKALRELTNLGLKEAKDLVDAAPKVIKEGIDKAAAEEIKVKLEAAGATVEIK